MVEEWKPIPGYEDEYEASNQGRIRSLDRTDRGGRRWKGRILKQTPTSRGYMTLTLPGGSGRVVHELIALAFVGPKPTPQHEVNHKNGQKADNRPANLEWVTRAQNLQHAREVLGRQLGARPGNRRAAKLTPAKVRGIRRVIALKMRSQKELAQVHGVHPSTISDIVRGKTYDAPEYYPAYMYAD